MQLEKIKVCVQPGVKAGLLF